MQRERVSRQKQLFNDVILFYGNVMVSSFAPFFFQSDIPLLFVSPVFFVQREENIFSIGAPIQIHLCIKGNKSWWQNLLLATSSAVQQSTLRIGEFYKQQSTQCTLYLHESVLLLLWVGLTVELYNKGKNMQILLQKYFHPVVAAAMARLGHRALS